jgi:hypothetical protein
MMIVLHTTMYAKYTLTFEESVYGGSGEVLLLQLLPVQHTLHNDDPTRWERGGGFEPVTFNS